MLIRTATDEDVPRVAELTFEAYVGDGLMPAESPYVAELTDAAARLAGGELIVAEIDGVVAGAVTFAAPGTAYAEKAGPGETEIRMLAVAKAHRGRGVGLALVRRCLARTLELGCDTVRLSTQEDMHAAHRLYEHLGFMRTPELDWYPVPDVPLITYALNLRAHEDGATDLEPPRRCSVCGRRMVVQVTPTGWSATCSVHGERTG